MGNLASWRTSIVGIATFIGVVVTQVIALTDSDPETVFQLDILIAAFGVMLASLAARDNNVSDQQAGARPEPPK